MYVWIKLSWRLKLLYNIKWVANCIGISGIIHFPNYQWEEEQFTLVFKCNVWTNLIRFPGHYISCETFFHKYSMDTPTKIAQEIRFILQGWFLEFLFLFLFYFTSQNPVWSHCFKIAMFAILGDLLFPRTVLFFVRLCFLPKLLSIWEMMSY